MSEKDIRDFIETVSKQVTERVLKELRDLSAAPTESACGDDAFECDGPKFECGDYAKFNCGNTFTCNNEFVG